MGARNRLELMEILHPMWCVFEELVICNIPWVSHKLSVAVVWGKPMAGHGTNDAHQAHHSSFMMVFNHVDENQVEGCLNGGPKQKKQTVTGCNWANPPTNSKKLDAIPAHPRLNLGMLLPAVSHMMTGCRLGNGNTQNDLFGPEVGHHSLGMLFHMLPQVFHSSLQIDTWNVTTCYHP